jgi:hypothetical protein
VALLEHISQGLEVETSLPSQQRFKVRPLVNPHHTYKSHHKFTHDAHDTCNEVESSLPSQQRFKVRPRVNPHHGIIDNRGAMIAIALPSRPPNITR